MPFLLRVALPDVPGSLGRVASAIGVAGGDIEAIEIVEHRTDGTAVDDVLLEALPGVMPDSLVSACNALEGVSVLWISRYAAGGGLFLDLEAVEELTSHPTLAVNRLVELLPKIFRADWAARVGQDGVLERTGAAPDHFDWLRVDKPGRLSSDDDENVLAAAPLHGNEFVVLARRGGPDILDSELARLGHLVALAVSISRS